MKRSAERALIGGQRPLQPLVVVQVVAYTHRPNGLKILIG